MNMRFIAAVTALMAISTIPAYAQYGNPGGLDPGTRESAPGIPAPGQTNVQDRLFATLAAQGGMAEVILGRLAQEKSRTEAVTAFAKQMIEEHGKSNAQLVQLAKQAGVPLPEELAPDQLEARQKLLVLDQAVFDAEYMRGQVTDHQKTLQLLLWVIASGEHADFQRFASDTVPTVLHHLQLAQGIVGRLTGAATP